MNEQPLAEVVSYTVKRLLFVAIVASTPIGVASAWADTSSALYEKDIKPLLVTYCWDCHGDGSERGGVALDKYGSHAELKRDVRLWQSVYDNVANEIMPPGKHPKPSLAERTRIASFIDRQVLGVLCDKPDPGRVTARRLNRLEYKNTIKDLLRVDFETSEEFPPDDSGYGFDNIGDVLSMSPMLMDKYFNAAERIVRKAIATGKSVAPEKKAKLWQIIDDTQPRRSVRETHWKIGRGGRYEIDLGVGIASFSPYRGPVAVTAELNGQPLHFKTYTYAGAEKTYQHTIGRTLEPGLQTLRVTLDWREATLAKPTHRVNMGVKKTLLRGPLGVDIVSESYRNLFFEGPAPSDPTKRRIYARAILKRVADRAFRRPVDEATLDRLLTLAMADPKVPFEVGIGQGLQAILVSPRFLFRTETQPRPDDPKAVHPIDEHALASRLSYWLWTTLPDGELLELANRGQLRANLKKQVARMLANPRANRFVSNFVGQWLQTRDVETTAINAELFPQLTPGIRSSMRAETNLLLRHIMNEDRDIGELLTADYSFLNEPLAKFYGVEGVTGHQMRKVALPLGSHRGGVLTHGSFLVVTSNPTRTSPVKRGLYVLENILGTPPPPAPPNIPTLEDARKEGKVPATVREQLEIHRANSACATCHVRMDPIGLGLENFNLVGQWRDKEGTAPIDPRGTLVTGETFTGVGELRRVLGERRAQFYRTVTRKLMIYALGRGLTPQDKCTVEGIVNDLLAGGGRFQTLIFGIINSAPFQNRRGDDGTAAQITLH